MAGSGPAAMDAAATPHPHAGCLVLRPGMDAGWQSNQITCGTWKGSPIH
jgi:hypothetical protein